MIANFLCGLPPKLGMRFPSLHGSSFSGLYGCISVPPTVLAPGEQSVVLQITSPSNSYVDALSEDASQVAQRSIPALFIVDSDLRIVLQLSEDKSRPSKGHGFVDEASGRLVPKFSEPIRKLISRRNDWTGSQCVVLPPTYVVSAFPVSGSLGQWIGISIQPLRHRNILAQAADRFALTRRELEVLTLILNGSSTSEIAGRLHIAETTVQGYFKQLLSKTSSHNRATMVARVLDWKSLHYASSEAVI